MPVDVRTEKDRATRHVVTIDGRTLHADLGVEAGGGTAPGAHDYFDASLAVCKALTAVAYARVKGFALDRVEAHVERDDSKEREGTYVLRVRLAFHGALSDAEKQRIHEVLGRCPIHKLMTTATVDVQTAPL